MDREITLRDYGRVLWSGRWLILAATVVAALVGLVLTLVTTTTYEAHAEVYLGQATTVSGTPVSTPSTNPATAPTALTGDNLVTRVARELGVPPGRVRDGVEVTAPRAPGGSVGNQPTIATITFTDDDREIARRGANLYAGAVLDQATTSSAELVGVYEAAVTNGEAEISRLERELQTYRDQLLGGAAGDRAVALQIAISSAQNQLAISQSNLTAQRLNLVTERRIGQPAVVSLAESPASSSSLPNRVRTVILAGIIGLIVGVIVTFVWRGSPAGRAGSA